MDSTDDDVLEKESSTNESINVEPFCAENSSEVPCSNIKINKNYPILCSTYKDLETQVEKVILAISVPRGAHNVTCDLGNKGLCFSVKYKWPKAL